MTLRLATRPALTRARDLRMWLPVVLAAAAVGLVPTWVLARQPPITAPAAPLPLAAAQPPKADPKVAPKAAPADEKTYTLNFDKASWDQILAWYATQSGLSLVTTAKPTGSATIKPPAGAKYTLGEVTDVLNEALLQQKFLLIRRHTSFFTHPVDEKLNVPDLPLVTLSDLAKRGKTEIVQAILPLKGTILVEDVAPEMDKFITKFGRVVPFPRTNTLLIQDTAGNVLRIMETLERVEVGGGGETLSHPCKYARARDVAEQLRVLLKDERTAVEANQAMGGVVPGGFDRRGGRGGVKSVQIATDGRTNTVYIAAPADKIAQARRFIEGMDRPRGKDDPGVKIEPPAIRVYPVPAGTADVFARTLAAANPGLPITAVPNSNGIVVLATPDEHDEARRQISGGEAGGGTATVLLPLRDADPREAAALVARFLPDGPIVDAQGGALLVQGTKGQIDGVRKLLTTTYGERFDDKGPATVPGGNARTIWLGNGSARALADLLADRAAGVGRNPVILDGANRNAPPTGRGPPPGVSPNPPAVRPMWAPTPLPD